MTSSPSFESPDGAASAGPDSAGALELLRRTNEFLALCVSQSEAALETEEPVRLIAALRAIRDSAGSVAGAGESLRRELLEPED